jgi:hypothetical protein
MHSEPPIKRNEGTHFLIDMDHVKSLIYFNNAIGKCEQTLLVLPPFSFTCRFRTSVLVLNDLCFHSQRQVNKNGGSRLVVVIINNSS